MRRFLQQPASIKLNFLLAAGLLAATPSALLHAGQDYSNALAAIDTSVVEDVRLTVRQHQLMRMGGNASREQDYMTFNKKAARFQAAVTRYEAYEEAIATGNRETIRASRTALDTLLRS